MIALFLLLVIVAIVLGIVGVVAKGLLFSAGHRNSGIPWCPDPGRPANAPDEYLPGSCGGLLVQGRITSCGPAERHDREEFFLAKDNYPVGAARSRDCRNT